MKELRDLTNALAWRGEMGPWEMVVAPAVLCHSG